MILTQAKLLVFLILAATEGGWMSRSPAQLQELWTEVRRQKSIEGVWHLVSDDDQWQVNNYLEVWRPKQADVQYPPAEVTAEVAHILAGVEIDTPQGGAYTDEDLDSAIGSVMEERQERARYLTQLVAEPPEEAPEGETAISVEGE